MTRRLLVASLLCGTLFGACKSGDAPASRASAIDPTNELPFGYIDVPSTGTHQPRTFVATGWALDDAGVASIRIFVDNKFVMPVDRRTVRDDLNDSFPKYTKDTRRHGWVATVNLPDTTSAGPHLLLVQLVDTGGLTRDLGPVTFVIDPAVPPASTSAPSPPPTLTGEMPFGLVDDPKPDAHVPRSFAVGGWALDDQGMREIRVFVDRVFNTVLPVKGDRRDVRERLALYAAANPTPGWSGTLTLPPGPHSLIFQAVDTNGLTRVLGIVAVVVEG